MNRLASVSLRLWPLFFLIIAAHAWGLSIPEKPSGHVNDYAGLLSEQDIFGIESDLRAFAASESTQIVVAIFPSLDGESLEDVGIRLADQWQIGRKGKDNGVILLIFPKDRKMRIEVGYGLEDRLTDAVASSIIRNEIAPHFKAGDYGSGVKSGIKAIEAAIRGTYAAESEGGEEDISFLSVFLILAFVAFIIYANRNRGYGHYTRSGFSSGGWSSGRSFGGGGFGGFSGGGGRFGGGGSSGGW